MPLTSTTAYYDALCKRPGQVQSNPECQPGVMGADMRQELLEEATRLRDSWPVSHDCNRLGQIIQFNIARIRENPTEWHDIDETTGQERLAAGQAFPDVASDPGPYQAIIARSDIRTGQRRQWSSILQSARHEAAHDILDGNGRVKYPDTGYRTASYLASDCASSGPENGNPSGPQLPYSLPPGGADF